MTLRASQIMSTVPTSCMQVESTVLPVPIEKVWPKFRSLQFDLVAPTYVTSTSVVGEGVGSVVTVTYKDETVWELRITEISVSFSFDIELVVEKAEMEEFGNQNHDKHRSSNKHCSLLFFLSL